MNNIRCTIRQIWQMGGAYRRASSKVLDIRVMSVFRTWFFYVTKVFSVTCIQVAVLIPNPIANITYFYITSKLIWIFLYTSDEAEYFSLYCVSFFLVNIFYWLLGNFIHNASWLHSFPSSPRSIPNTSLKTKEEEKNKKKTPSSICVAHILSLSNSQWPAL